MAKRKDKNTYDIDYMVELVAQIFLTCENCSPDFDDMTMHDVMEFLEFKKRDNTHMSRLVLSNSAIRLIEENSKNLC